MGRICITGSDSVLKCEVTIITISNKWVESLNVNVKIYFLRVNYIPWSAYISIQITTTFRNINIYLSMGCL